MLTEGNSKLGRRLHCWSIPPGRAKTCPGETNLCRTRCYAKHGFFYFQNVQDSQARNLELTKRDDFTHLMTADILYRQAEIIRVHVAGDFYSPEYIDKWCEIASRNPRVRFFAYTRSWRVEECLPNLIQLRNCDNFSLWWSVDRETGTPPFVSGVRRAYMAINDADARTAPDDCDLVFRVNTGTVMKKANSVQVCPVENGVPTQVKMTCSRCGICWKPKTPQWEITDELAFVGT